MCRTPHPESPHTPPSDFTISEAEVARCCTVLYCTVLHCTALYCTVLARFHRDGFLVLRRVLTPATIATLNSASADLRTNKTLHCQMAYYNGPPIFHKVCNPNLLCGPLK